MLLLLLLLQLLVNLQLQLLLPVQLFLLTLLLPLLLQLLLILLQLLLLTCRRVRRRGLLLRLRDGLGLLQSVAQPDEGADVVTRGKTPFANK